MEALIIILVILALWLYTRWLKRGIAPRTINTRLTNEQLSACFRQSVTGTAWKVVDDGSPIIAEGGLSDWWTVLPFIGYIVGGKQQLALAISDQPEDDRRLALVGSLMFIPGVFMPVKGHTLRVRLNRFENSIRESDPSVLVQRHPKLLNNPPFNEFV